MILESLILGAALLGSTIVGGALAFANAVDKRRTETSGGRSKNPSPVYPWEAEAADCSLCGQRTHKVISTARPTGIERKCPKCLGTYYCRFKTGVFRSR